MALAGGTQRVPPVAIGCLQAALPQQASALPSTPAPTFAPLPPHTHTLIPAHTLSQLLGRHARSGHPRPVADLGGWLFITFAPAGLSNSHHRGSPRPIASFGWPTRVCPCKTAPADACHLLHPSWPFKLLLQREFFLHSAAAAAQVSDTSHVAVVCEFTVVYCPGAAFLGSSKRCVISHRPLPQHPPPPNKTAAATRTGNLGSHTVHHNGHARLRPAMRRGK